MIKIILFCTNEIINIKIATLLQNSENSPIWHYKYFDNSFQLSKHLTTESCDLMLVYHGDYENFLKENKNKNFKTAILSLNQDPMEIAKTSLLEIDDYILIDKKYSQIIPRIKDLLHGDTEDKPPKFRYIVGNTLEKITTKLQKVIKTKLNSILVTGETGTGKEIVADCLQNLVEKNTPFYKLNCASLSNELLESELFGHEKGSFTGAYKKKDGLLQKANNGWVFLDEIACLPQKAQSSLLRFLETGEIRPVGQTKNIILNVKILSATNESLFKLVEKGFFRQDLLERLRLYEIEIPPLRERSISEKNQILNCLIEKICHQNNTPIFKISKELRLILMSYKWQSGNIREMRNILYTIMINKKFDTANVFDLPKSFLKKITKQEQKDKKDHKNTSKAPNQVDTSQSYQTLESNLFLNCLESIADNSPYKKLNHARIAKHLNISRWKTYAQLKKIQDSSLLPAKYQYLLK